MLSGACPRKLGWRQRAWRWRPDDGQCDLCGLVGMPAAVLRRNHRTAIRDEELQQAYQCDLCGLVGMPAAVLRLVLPFGDCGFGKAAAVTGSAGRDGAQEFGIARGLCPRNPAPAPLP